MLVGVGATIVWPLLSGSGDAFAGLAAHSEAELAALLRDGLRPRVLELADRHSIDHVRAKSRYRFPANAGAIVKHASGFGS